jgi:hypothetical protein
MRVIVCQSTGRVRTIIMRGLVDDERRLTISTPWQQPPAETLAAIADQLTTEEAAEVARAFGLDTEGTP